MQGSGLGGLDVIRRMRSHDPRTRILVFSMHSDPIIARARSRPAPPAMCSRTRRRTS